MKLECQFCHEDLGLLSPEANIFRHRVGLCAPSRNEVDAGLLELEEMEKERTRKALAYVNSQRYERRPFRIRWSAVALWASILAFTGFVYGFLWAWLGPLIHRVLKFWGIWQ